MKQRQYTKNVTFGSLLFGKLCFVLVFIALWFSVLQVHLDAQYYHFTTYSVEEGLSQSQIYSVFQCSSGYIWVGTFGGGLNRFDGKRFLDYTTEDGLSDNVVYHIIQDRKGYLWFGTDNGLNKYDGKSFTSYTDNDGLHDSCIRTLYEDPGDGKYLWLGTYDSGLIRFDPERIQSTRFTRKDGLVSDSIRAIIKDRDGKLWIGTIDGVSIYNGTTFVDSPVTRHLSGFAVYHITIDRKHRLWFATNRGAYCYDGNPEGNLKRFDTTDGLCHNDVKWILEDSRGNFWFATSNGVSEKKGDTFTTYSQNNGLSHNLVESIIEDREGNIWFATDSGISQFKGKAFTYFNKSNGLLDDFVWSFWEKSDGVYWIASAKGVVEYSEKDSHLKIIRNVPEGTLFPFYEDHRGHLWFGNGSAIYRYDRNSNRNSFYNFSSANNLEDVELYSIFEDSRGNMWFGTRSRGVMVYNGKNIVNFKKKDGLIARQVNAIVEDSIGNIWIGTPEGLSIYDGKSFYSVTAGKWLGNRYVMSLIKGPGNNVWVGTYGGGVTRITPLSGTEGKNRRNREENGPHSNALGNVDTFTGEDGLSHGGVGILEFDDNGNLWIGTTKGISVLDVKRFERTGEKVFRSYGNVEGFRGIECNQNSILKDSKGNLWFGTIRGATRLNPAEERSNTIEPLLHLTAVTLFFQTGLDWEQNHELEYYQNHLTFNFIGLSLTVPERVKYQVKLEGFDSDWLPPSSAGSITYSNLPPGDYNLLVRACNNSGIWNRSPLRYNFRITPPFWNTTWFYILVVLTVLGGFVLYIRLRVQKFKRRQKVLEELVNERTRELATEKTKVEESNRLLEQRVQERTRKLEEANKQLINAQKMEALGTLAGGVAHDLNNVLAGIVSYPELLLLELEEDHPLHPYVLAIQRSGEKAAAIVQDMLTLARARIAAPEPVNLNSVITDFLKSPEYQKILSYHPNVMVGTNLAKNLNNLMGSSVHLSKVLMNLLSNAAEALPEGGTIRIDTFNRYLDQPLPGQNDVVEGEYVCMSIADTGIGMTEEDMEHIYEPFYTRKKMGKSGTGLGMSVVWGTVCDHKGYITVESSPGKGSTFELYFPVTFNKVMEKKNNISLDRLKGQGEFILVVDDVEEQRHVTTLMLKALRYNVKALARGEDAVEYLKENAADLIILDMIMEPGINGLETYKRILDFKPGQKAIIVSGYSETDEILEARQLGAGVYIKKPFGMADIGLAVQEELAK
jgi:ligand-binding sensor domain-containing protein/signal transduction histidine kinase